MDQEHREWWLFAVMAVLLVAVVLVAWNDVPPFTPPSITYHSTQTADPATASDTDEEAGDKISINRATAAELMQLDGVGEVLAERIIAYREEHGPFSTVEELVMVQGVGEKRLAEWMPYLTV